MGIVETTYKRLSERIAEKVAFGSKTEVHRLLILAFGVVPETTQVGRREFSSVGQERTDKLPLAGRMRIDKYRPKQELQRP